MQNQIILIISHSALSSNKLLLKSIQQKGLDTKLAIFVNFNGFDENGVDKYNFELCVLDKKEITEEQEVLKNSLPSSNDCFLLNEAIDVLFNCLDHVIPGINVRGLTNIFDFHLFVEANLTRPAHETITQPFHDAIHLVGRKFSDLANFAKSKFNVYGFSNTNGAVRDANRYFNNDEVNGLKMDVFVHHAVADSKLKISSHIKSRQTESPAIGISVEQIENLSVDGYIYEVESGISGIGTVERDISPEISKTISESYDSADVTTSNKKVSLYAPKQPVKTGEKINMTNGNNHSFFSLNHAKVASNTSDPTPTSKVETTDQEDCSGKPSSRVVR